MRREGGAFARLVARTVRIVMGQQKQTPAGVQGPCALIGCGKKEPLQDIIDSVGRAQAYQMRRPFGDFRPHIRYVANSALNCFFRLIRIFVFANHDQGRGLNFVKLSFMNHLGECRVGVYICGRNSELANDAIRKASFLRHAPSDIRFDVFPCRVKPHFHDFCKKAHVHSGKRLNRAQKGQPAYATRIMNRQIGCVPSSYR